MSDTPRTDAAAFIVTNAANALVLANTARELERELNAAKVAEAQAIIAGNMVCDSEEVVRERVRKFVADFRKVRWAWDGDCGSGALVDALENDLKLSP